MESEGWRQSEERRLKTEKWIGRTMKEYIPKQYEWKTEHLLSCAAASEGTSPAKPDMTVAAERQCLPSM